MKKALRRFGSFFIAHHIDVAGKYANQTRTNLGETIFVYFIIGIIILIAIFCIHPSIDTAGWFGTHVTP